MACLYNTRMLAEATGILVPHEVAEVCVMAFALTLCYALWAGGALARAAGGGLPAVPQYPDSLFPNKWDQAYAVLFFAFLVLTTIYGRNEDSGGDMSAADALVNLVLLFALYAPMLVRYFTLRKLPRRRFGFFKAPLTVLAYLVLIWLSSAAVAASGLNDWLISTTGCPEMQDVAQDLQRENTPITTLYVAIAAVFQAPICEECAFRGFLYNILKKHAGRVAATLASALFFASIHASLPQLLPLFFFGVVQCLAYEKAKSLWLPVCIHAAFNAASVLSLLHSAS